MDFDSPAEAFAAIAGLVVGADAVGSSRERDYLFGDVRSLAVFAGLDDAAYAGLVADVVGRLVDEFGTDEGVLAPSAAAEVAAAACAVLDEDRRIQALGMARSLAGADGAAAAEGDVLERLRIGLEG